MSPNMQKEAAEGVDQALRATMERVEKSSG